MDNSRCAYISKIATLEEAIRKTKSDYLRKDYRKAVSRMRRELKAYDRFKREAGAGV